MKVLLLDNYDSFTYNLVQIIRQGDKTDLSVYKNDEIGLEDVQKFDKIVLSPGAGLPQEAGIMKELIAHYASSKAILGVCLGHQAIGEVFGAKLINLNQVYHGQIHQVEIVNSSDYLFKNLPVKIEVGLYHSWAIETESLPKSLKISALSEKNIIMAISHQNYDVKGIQFHPESIMTPYGKQILKNWLAN